VPAPRAAIPRRVAIRLAAAPFGHPVLRALARVGEYPRPVRALALAITRAELACRPAWRRVLEYAYVWLQVPGYPRVTVGPMQIRLATLHQLHEAAPCCASVSRRRRLRPRAVLAPDCYARAALAHVEQLLTQHTSTTAAANAHNKGAHATDLPMKTAYTVVVSQLTAVYDGILR